MSSSANLLSTPARQPGIADLYTFHWSEIHFRLPLVSSFAVALCLFTGIFAGHPGGGLIAGGGALTIGFGANQRIADSRLLPMIFAIFATSTSTLAGTLAGHSGYALLLVAAASALIYGLLTAQGPGLAWVGQQASVALLVASAFPTGPRPAFIRAGLIVGGGMVQLLVTSIGLRLMPELRKDLFSLPGSVYATLREHQGALLHPVGTILEDQSAGYSVRLVLTMLAATWAYLHLGIQSGYWIPMTALLVQKPAFAETATRATARIVGTLVGAWLGSLFIAHLEPSPAILAAFTTFFAFWTFATNGVNYGLFTASLTAYIVFLLSLNQIPGTVIAHRRAWCTIVGGILALILHIDSLRHRRSPAIT